MTGPTASSRSSNFSLALTPAAITADKPVCLAFVSGVKASSANNYQLNVTCVIDNAASAIVMATVYPSTMVSKLSFYVVVWDPVVLAVQSYLFVDYAVTTTYYNTQSSPLSLPYGYLDRGYCGGMASFSTTSQQELNYTLSSLTLATSQTSLYDSAPQFQVRVRNCSSSTYPFYNRADGLCYPVCPGYTYSVAGAFLCSACPSNCLTCLNASICTSCSPGMLVVNSACQCANSSFLWGSTCMGCDYSCLTCVATGQYYNCLSCDPSNYRTAVSVAGFNYKCACNTGYYDNGVGVCSEICGDGNARSDACDDGNSNSGDGCSSACAIEANFTCSKNGVGLSSCFYIGNVTIEEVKTFKSDYENVFRVYLQLSPWIDSMALLANSISLTSNLTKATPVDYSVEHGLLVYSFMYNEDIEGQIANVFLKPLPNTIFAQLPPANCTF
jgi:cysteine-rich repeat protein